MKQVTGKGKKIRTFKLKVIGILVRGIKKIEDKVQN